MSSFSPDDQSQTYAGNFKVGVHTDDHTHAVRTSTLLTIKGFVERTLVKLSVVLTSDGGGRKTHPHEASQKVIRQQSEVAGSMRVRLAWGNDSDGPDVS